jgi:hypothetical protein
MLAQLIINFTEICKCIGPNVVSQSDTNVGRQSIKSVFIFCFVKY